MKCMSKELMGILPPPIRDKLPQELLDSLQEIRMRTGCPVHLRTDGGDRRLGYIATKEDLNFVIHTASRYSPWNAATMAKGYLTAQGGHRIGICGDAVMDKGLMKGIRVPSSLCIRVAKEIPGVGQGIDLRENLLLIGPPGSGKTTLLRDLVRRLRVEKRGMVAVVDERAELFPQWGGVSCFDSGNEVDILTGCPKPEGIQLLLRCMGPDWICVDEVTAREDCDALVQAAWCGVRLIATAHAAGVEDLLGREIYRPLVELKLFHNILVLSRDKSVRMERVIV